MKELMLFYFPECPHCKNAFKWQEEIFQEHPEYRQINIKAVNERAEPEYADTFDYFYVPTYYMDGRKLCEGVTEKSGVEKALNAAYKS